MRAMGILVVVLLVAPGATASTVSLAHVETSTAPGDPGGPGCMPDPDSGATCLWEFNDTDKYQDTSDPRAYPFYAIPLPANATYPVSLATVTVEFAGQDNGWSVGFQSNNATEGHRISTAGHAADTSATVGHTSTSTHLLVVPQGYDLALHVWTSYSDRYDHKVNATPPSLGTWRVVVRIEPLPDGVRPIRPAATRADPQLRTGALEAAEPDRDLREAWLDDAKLGDGLFEAHLAVASLDRVDFNHTRDFGLATDQLDWVLQFRVKGVLYNVTWTAQPAGEHEPRWSCELLLAATDAAEPRSKVVSPFCRVDVPNATFTAFIPERSVRSPTSDDLFTDLHAASLSYPGSPYLSGIPILSEYAPQSPVPDTEDQTQPADMQYAFALGGPAVWHTLNPRLDPPPDIIPAWYIAPLAKENIPNTLQVVGAVAAGITFLVGALAVVARRRQLRKHLDRIDEVERSRQFDSSATLRELGLLEDEFARLYRKGRINESQFQVLSQRIASVATRFALRRELGLDDGVPGPEGPAVRVAVKDGAAPATRE